MLIERIMKKATLSMSMAGWLYSVQEFYDVSRQDTDDLAYSLDHSLPPHIAYPFPVQEKEEELDIVKMISQRNQAYTSVDRAVQLNEQRRQREQERRYARNL